MSGKKTNKVKILEYLMEAPRTTGELAQLLGYVEGHNIGYHIIDKDMKGLRRKKYIVGEMIKNDKRGKPPTLYSIRLTVPNLEAMLREYPILISAMENSEYVRSLLFMYRTPAEFIYSVFSEKKE